MKFEGSQNPILKNGRKETKNQKKKPEGDIMKKHIYIFSSQLTKKSVLQMRVKENY